MARIDRRRVSALAYDGLGTFELGIVVEVFGLPRPEMGKNWSVPRLLAGTRSASRDRRIVPADAQRPRGSGPRGHDHHSGMAGRRYAARAPCRALRRPTRAARGWCRLLGGCSCLPRQVCSTAVAQRRTGAMSTRCDRYTRRSAVEPDVLYVDEGASDVCRQRCGIDLCLHIVRRDFGAEDRQRWHAGSWCHRFAKEGRRSSQPIPFSPQNRGGWRAFSNGPRRTSIER